MRAVLLRTTGFSIAALCAAAAWGQTAAQETRAVFSKVTETPQQLQEIVNLIGAITNGGLASTDAAEGILSVRGTAEQVKLAEWLVKQIDKPGGVQPSQQGALVTPEYIAGDDDVVRLLHVNNARTVQEFQDFSSAVRAIPEMRLAFAVNSRVTLVVRGTREQVRLADWLVNELDKPAAPLNTAASPANPVATSANPPAPEYRISGSLEKSPTPENVVRVFYLTQAPTVQEFQEVVTLVRSITECRRTVSVNAPRALAMRGTAEQIGLAEFLYNEVQAAKQPSPDTSAAGHEYRISPAPPFPASPAVRVFHVMGTGTVQEFQEFAKAIQNKGQIRQLFTYNEPRLLVVRGWDNQIALAEQMVEDRRRLVAQ